MARSAHATGTPARRFLARIAPESHLQIAFNQLHGVRAVIKDRDGNFVWVSDNVARRCGFEAAGDMCGLSDFDINPPDLARAYAADDQRVLRSGLPILGKMELSFDEQGVLEWVTVNKIPLRDRQQTTIGLIATIQPVPDRSVLPVHGDQLTRVIGHIQSHLADPLHADDLADMVGLSKRQLERRFRQFTGCSPREFVIRCRVREARRLLQGAEQSISSIAHAIGFCDQSALTKAFRRHTQMTPLQYRRAARHHNGHSDVADSPMARAIHTRLRDESS